jgi:hypothetical protein
MWMIAAVVVVILAGAGGAYYLLNSDDSDVPAVEDDEGVVELPQNPSLRLFDEGGTWYVENDGNVTMSEIEVRDASGNVVCSLGTVSPGDRAACEEATDGEGLTATGSGPQGQPVEVVPVPG